MLQPKRQMRREQCELRHVPSEDIVGLYCAEARETPLLSAQDEARLASRIELANYLSQLEQDWYLHKLAQPTPSELLLVLFDRFCQARPHFEALCTHLGIGPGLSVLAKVEHPAVSDAIGGCIDHGLVDAVADRLGARQADIGRALLRLSLDVKLIPWFLLLQECITRSPAVFVRRVRANSFRSQAQNMETALQSHFDTVRNEGSAALDLLVRSNLRLVMSIARRYSRWGIPVLDLIQEGNMGLMHAARKFDQRRGCRFSTYATWWIKQSISRSVARQTRPLRLPAHVVTMVRRLERSRQSLNLQYGRNPTIEEIATTMQLDVSVVRKLQTIEGTDCVSLDMPIGDPEDGCCLLDMIDDQVTLSPEEEAAKSEVNRQIRDSVTSLTNRERRVIELRFGLGDGQERTLKQVGKEIGVTRERVRQIETKALRKLRDSHRPRQRDFQCDPGWP